MKLVGHVSQWKELHAIWLAVMLHKNQTELPDGTRIFTRRFKNGKLFGIDHAGKRYIEQNPETHSAYAERARRGSKIMWIIDLSTNQYLGRIDEEQVFMQEHLAARVRA